MRFESSFFLDDSSVSEPRGGCLVSRTIHHDFEGDLGHTVGIVDERPIDIKLDLVLVGMRRQVFPWGKIGLSVTLKKHGPCL